MLAVVAGDTECGDVQCVSQICEDAAVKACGDLPGCMLDETAAGDSE